MAVFMLSAVVVIGSTLSYPNIVVICSSHSPSASLRNAREVSGRRETCSHRAFIILWWQCPWLTDEYAARKSKYLCPSVSHTKMPLPR